MSDRLSAGTARGLFIGGASRPSASGRTTPVRGPGGALLARVAAASRADARDAVRAARAAQPGWADRTARGRGRVLYRIAEVMEGRAAPLAGDLAAAGVPAAAARQDVEAAVDAAVWWAGLADKLDHLVGTVNPVAGPFLNLSAPIPVGVCALACPAGGAVSGIVGLVLPAIMAGNAAVAVAGGPEALVAGALGEAIAAADVPGGVVNLLTGEAAALLPWLADHGDVDLIDLSGAPPGMDAGLEERAAADLKRVTRTGGAETVRTAAAFCELRTVWHPARI